MRARIREALLSIYLYNEHRGYTQLEALAAAIERAQPQEQALLDAIRAHARDERRHYKMFRAWFQRRGVMPLRVDAEAGYIDRLVRAVTSRPLDDIDLEAAVRDPSELQRLLRLIVLTEERGLEQVRFLLRAAPLLFDRDTTAMFTVVERDEPSHFLPYRRWLDAHAGTGPTRRERFADLRTHLGIVWVQMPRLLLGVSRVASFPA